MVSVLVPPLLAGFAIAFLLTPLSIKLARLLKLIDDPKTHRHPAIIHTKPIPRAGGLPIYLAILTSSLLFLPMDNIFSAILIAGFFVVVTGLLDDRFDMSPYLRFLLNIVAASIVVMQGVTIPFITNPLGGILEIRNIPLGFVGLAKMLPITSLLAIFWIVWVMNMLNWSKGVDGQMPGIAVISALIIGIASLRFPVIETINVHAAQMSFIVAGSALGFLVYNFYPAKIFPGYSSTILGFTIAILAILSGVKLATAILVMGVPTVDAVATIIRRILSKRSPFWHDRGHLHHLLLNLGLNQRSVAVFYWFMSAVLGVAALSLSSRGKLFAIILVVVLVGGTIITLKFISRAKEYEN